MPKGFTFPSTAATPGEPPALWVPLLFTADQLNDWASSFDTSIVARLRPAASLEQAQDDVKRVSAQFQGSIGYTPDFLRSVHVRASSTSSRNPRSSYSEGRPANKIRCARANQRVRLPRSGAAEHHGSVLSEGRAAHDPKLAAFGAL